MVSVKKGFSKKLEKTVESLEKLAAEKPQKEKRVVISNSIRADLEQKLHEHKSKVRKKIGRILDEALELYFTEFEKPASETGKEIKGADYLNARQTDIEEFTND